MASGKPNPESQLGRNPHRDFRKVETSRPDWDVSRSFSMSKTRAPAWKFGDGATDDGASLGKDHIEIDPNAQGRSVADNYKLLISGIVPRPVAFVSTRSEDGSSTNLAPFSYFQTVNADPPIFIIAYDGAMADAKDSLKNLMSTGECCINIISEHFIEAANATAINAPYGVSEWALSGLTPAPCSEVRPSRVKESVFSIEAKLVDTKEFESRRTPGKKTSVSAFVEGVRFWVREDALNKDQNLIDPEVLRPMARLGGISYARILDGIEIPRPDFDQSLQEGGVQELVKPKLDDQ